MGIIPVDVVDEDDTYIYIYIYTYLSLYNIYIYQILSTCIWIYVDI